MTCDINTGTGLLARLLGLSLLAAPACSPPATEQPALQWRLSTPLPEPRAGYAAGVLDGKLVIAGGTYWEGEKDNWTRKLFSTSTHAFDPETETWERLPDAPLPFGYAAYTVVQNRLYVLGGYDGQKENSQILTLQREGSNYVWNSAGELPETRLFAWAGSAGSKIYLLGGVREFEPIDEAGSCCTSETATNQLMMLDTKVPDQGWKELPPYPGRKRWLFAAENDGRNIWMFGGIHSDDPYNPKKFDDVVSYHLASGAWEKHPPLPADSLEQTPLVPVHVEGKILLMSFARTVWQLDLSTMQYSTITPLPEEAFVDRFFWLNDRVIGAGGENKIQSPRRRSEWTFVGEFR